MTCSVKLYAVAVSELLLASLRSTPSESGENIPSP